MTGETTEKLRLAAPWPLRLALAPVAAGTRKGTGSSCGSDKAQPAAASTTSINYRYYVVLLQLCCCWLLLVLVKVLDY
jgi:hypothetical protein